MTEQDLRPGELRLTLDPPADATLRFVGRLRTPFTSREMCPRQGRSDGPECAIEVTPEWVPALQGIEAFERIEVLYWLDRSRRDLAVQNPKSDGRTVGTFALRSPVRPNPMGTSIVTLVRREGDRLIVRGLDCLDGTPLVDLKPQRCIYSVQAPHKAADGM